MVSGSCFELMLSMKLRKHNNRQRNYFSKIFHKIILKSNSEPANDVRVTNLPFLSEFYHFSHFNDKRQTNMTF